MRVFIPLVKGHVDIHNMWNPYIYTLTDYLEKEHQDIEFFYNIEMFGTKEVFSFDIVHIMWPDIFFYIGDVSVYRERLRQIKREGSKIIITCHNSVPHYIDDKQKKLFYEVTYQEADIIIHLGKCSRTLFEEMYPKAKHVLIPHHVYDTVYTDICKRKPFLKRYIACIGAFRDKEEINLLKEAGKTLAFTRYFILAPSLMINAQWKRRNKLALIWPVFKMVWLRWRYHIVTYDKRWINHDSLTKYMNSSCISFISRVANLNSGNLTLGFLFGNVVVGPNIGNIGEILRDLGNPTFDPKNMESLKSAMNKAIHLHKCGKGKDNKKYALNNWSTRIIAEKHYKVYVSMNTRGNNSHKTTVAK